MTNVQTVCGRDIYRPADGRRRADFQTQLPLKSKN